MSRISELRRQEILMAACHEFHERNIKSVSMADIAQQAQIGKSTIYEYFSSKEDLIRQAGLWLLENYTKQMENVFSSQLSMHEQINRYLDSFPAAHCNVSPDFSDFENLIQFVRIFGEESLQEEVQQFQKRIQVLLSNSISCAVERGELPAKTDPVLASQLMQALLNPMCITQLKRSGLDNAAKQAAQIILDGLAHYEYHEASEESLCPTTTKS